MTETIAARRPRVLWAPENRVTTTGMLLVVTLVAFENMGVATAMPTTVAALGGQSLYSWPFTAFLIASVVATVLSGRVCDVRGPGPSLLTGPVVFLVGLLVAGTASSMTALLLGRVLQGLGTGILLVAFALLIALVFDDHQRPAVYAANAAAWVLPAVVGPGVAGFVTERVGWRWVFLGLVPLVLVGFALLVLVVRRLPVRRATPGGRRGGVVAAVAAACGVAALTWAAQHPSAPAAGYGAAGLFALGWALRRLLPEGTLTARPGLPTVVASRALICGAFAAMEAYLPLTMTTVHGWGPAAAGLPLTVTAVGWSAGSAVQGRYPGWSREGMLRTGFLLVALALAAFAFVSQPWCPPWVAFAASAVGGAGMGLAMPAISLLLLRFSPVAERGFNTSALQLGDWVSSAITVGLGGVLLGLLGSAAAPSSAVAVLATAMVLVAAIGSLLTRRWPAPSPP
ncbi:MFS transporter [Amycolatopsis antarctica]|uniref:MFS transporter n=1 Tax=Amycolatopsis antarctica TaxID=1854586 RepID=A0A263D695_9PSEU|nr:MFS transporter [Amycolatopsis antarctica]OZM74032.1 MFS transporter [Amycolatopsis antarctica]